MDVAHRRRAFERALRGPVGASEVEKVRVAVQLRPRSVPVPGSEGRAL